MAIRVNPKLIDDLEKYGSEDVSKCYHCGNCSAVCPHSKEPFIFPRRPMRTLQMGLESKLKHSLEPWLCYYCGQCSEQCPREAEPGETMMGLRRWLTAQYDVTGISRLTYRSWKFDLLFILVLGALTCAGLLLYGFTHGDIHDYDGPNAFLPVGFVHLFDLGLAVVLISLVVANSARMWWFTIGSRKGIKVPILHYLRGVYLLPLHFFTQKRFAQCGNKTLWALHLVLVLSYLTMLLLISFFLAQMQAGPEINWAVHVFGYLAAIGILGTTIFMLQGRLKQNRAQFKHTHSSDWMFLFLLLYVCATGVLQHVLHRSGLNLWANVVYVAHLMGVVAWLSRVLNKWSHLAYRPLAMFFGDLMAVPLRATKKMPEVAQMQPARGPKEIPDTVALPSAGAAGVSRYASRGKSTGSRADLSLSSIETNARKLQRV